MDVVSSVKVHALQHILQPVIWVDVMQPAGSKQRIDHRCPLSRLMRACKQVILSSNGNRADGILYRVIVYMQQVIGGINT